MDGTGLDLLLQRLAAGDGSAASELLPRIYGELRSIARLYVRRERPGHSLQATALVHEAYLRLLGEQVGPNAPPVASRAHFLALGARAMRQLLVEHARRKARAKRGGGADHVQIRTDLGLTDGPDVEILALHNALEDLRQLNERQARCVELLYFGGLTAAEAGEVLGTSARTVERDLHTARAWLRRRLEREIPFPEAGSTRHDGASQPQDRKLQGGKRRPSRSRTGGDDGTPPRIGRYAILGTLGEGGSGTVFLAQDPILQRTVALKRLSLELTHHPEARARLEEEARALAALQHPNIATVFSLEMDEEQNPFLTLERVDGPALGELCRGEPIPFPRGLQIAREIAHALEAAAQVGVVHGDLTPANVLLTRDGHAKVVDFGLARRFAPAHRSSTPKSKATGTSEAADPAPRGPVAGTPGYMSPEQARGEGASFASDVWSFGCILFELLGGSAAFPGETGLERIRSILEQEPRWERLEREPLQRVAPLVRRCLSKDPAERPSSIRVARRYLEGELLRLRTHRERSREVPLPAGARKQRLPLPLDRFVGRREERARILDALRERAFVSVLGPGGVGKTRLALEVASQLGQTGPEPSDLEPQSAVLFADLSRSGSLESALVDVLQIETRGAQSQAELIEHDLRTRAGVIVLDGCEIQREAVQRFFSRPDLDLRPRFLFTSRVRLGIPGEARIELEPLPIATAADLFCARATEAIGEPAGPLPSSRFPSEQVERLCRDLDGLPLALELAAARLRTISFHDLLARASDLRTLGTAREDVPTRHRDLSSLVAWSEQLLPAETQALFHALGLLAPGWDLEAVEALAEVLAFPKWQVIDRLTALIDHSLVVVDRGEPETAAIKTIAIDAAIAKAGSGSPGNGRDFTSPEYSDGAVRYRMLTSVASYASSRCESSPVFRELHRRIVTHYLDRIERESGRVHGPYAAAATQNLMRDRPNWLRALSWVQAEGDLVTGLRMVAGLDSFWRTRGLGQEAREFADAFLAMAPVDPEAPQLDANLAADLGRVSHLRGVLHLFAGELDLAEAALRRAHRLGERYSSPDVVGRALNDLGGVALHRERWDEAIDWFTRGLRSAEERGEHRRAAIAHSNLGLVAHRRSDFETAQREYTRALELATRIEDRRLMGVFSGNLAAVAINTGRGDEARKAAEDILEVARRLGDPRHEATARHLLAVLHFQDGAVAEARAELIWVARTCEAIRDLVTLLSATSGLALIEERAGRPELSARIHGFNRHTHETTGVPVRDSRLRRELELSHEQLVTVLGADTFARLLQKGASETLVTLLKECEVDPAVGPGS